MKRLEKKAYSSLFEGALRRSRVASTVSRATRCSVQALSRIPRSIQLQGRRHGQERRFVTFFRISRRNFAAASAHAETPPYNSSTPPYSTRVATYYDVLGISDRGCDRTVIKKQFRELAKKYHPDHSEEPDADLRFREVREAYEVLGSKWKRSLYDQDLRNITDLSEDVEEESWTEHWNTETDREKESRRERYQRYVNRERTDIPPPSHSAPLFTATLVGAVGAFGIWRACVAVPEVEGYKQEESFSDPEIDMMESSLVFAYYNPCEACWERIIDPSSGDSVPVSPALLARREAGGRTGDETSDTNHLQKLDNYLTAQDLSRMRSYVPEPRSLYALYNVHLKDEGDEKPEKIVNYPLKPKRRLDDESRGGQPDASVAKLWPRQELPVLLMSRCRVRYWPPLRFDAEKLGWVRQ
ncbi:unnamed protein product [Amoebophrya sp. A25]|nr:unnamed protein product [Amoebophrya sp. A25]|eukprot:GSA25T00018274001.1